MKSSTCRVLSAELAQIVTKSQIICDNCGKTKGETNHWFKAQAMINTVTRNHALKIEEATSASDASDADLCGHACVHRWVDKWLTERGASK